jgi:hypothetical protein
VRQLAAAFRARHALPLPGVRRVIAVVDYGAGNLRSVCKALDRFEIGYKVVSSAEGIAKAEGIILPGVGHFGSAWVDLGFEGRGCEGQAPVWDLSWDAGSVRFERRGTGGGWAWLDPGRREAVFRGSADSAYGLERRGFGWHVLLCEQLLSACRTLYNRCL